MAIFDQAKDLLLKTEVGLRDLVRDAAVQGDYEAIIRLTHCAQKMSELVNHVAERDKPAQEVVVASSDVRSQPSQDQATNGAATRKSRSNRPATGKKRRTKRETQKENGYPKFFRRGTDLVKVGWSKQGRKEYQHRAPRSVLSLVAAAITDARSEGNLVSTNDFMPVMDGDAGTEIPAYQVYLSLGWFKQEGLVEQDGRQGYRVNQPEQLESEIETRWKQLKES